MWPGGKGGVVSTPINFSQEVWPISKGTEVCSTVNFSQGVWPSNKGAGAEDSAPVNYGLSLVVVSVQNNDLCNSHVPSKGTWPLAIL